MALSMSVTLTDNFNKDVVFEAAYITVSKITGDKTSCIAAVCWQEQKGAQVLKMQDYNIPFALTESNIISQCYLHLKTLDEFSHAVDC